MIQITDNFFNKVATEIRLKYFQNENHFTTNNKNYYKTTYLIELFNNGCLAYDDLVNKLSKSCKDDTKNIHNIVKKYIVRFGDFKTKYD